MATGRSLDNWIASYLDYTEKHEAPEKLHWWTALAVLSAALQRKVWMDRGYPLYPNIYAITVAESAKIRKSAAVNLGVKILKRAIPGIPTIRDSMTPEGLVANLNRIGKGGEKESHIFIHADELATLFTHDKQRASKLSILLTQLYNCENEYVDTTKTGGQIVLHNNYTTVLAATDPFNLKVLPEDAVGGFLGRCVFVIGKDRRRNVPWPEFPKALEDRLVADLARINTLSGKMVISDKARTIFDQWYDQISEQVVTERRLAAFQARMHDTMWKVAMLLSIGGSNSLILDSAHVVAAIKVVEEQRKEFSILADWSQTSIFATNKQRWTDLMKRNGGVATRKMMLKQLGLSVDEVITLQHTLVEEDTIRVIVVDPKRPAETIYKFTADEIARHNF